MLKTPLRLINEFGGQRPGSRTAVADAAGKIIFNVTDDADAIKLAAKVVERENETETA
jgi:hypothetical protein